MAEQMYAGKPSSFYSATGGKPVEGAWYSGQRYLGGQLLAPGERQPGQQVSNEVIAQTNPNNVSYVQSQRMQANQLQAPAQVDLPSSTASQEYVTGLAAQQEQARKALDDQMARQKAEADAKVEELRTKEKETLGEIKSLTTPFREDLENAERDRLHINENFEANQELVNELDTLLTEGNELIRQAQEVTGLAAVRNPRIQKAMDDVAARAGVIEAVINARNGQISVAENMIDRSVNAIAADRQDQIAYYQTVLELDRQDILNLEGDSKKMAEEQLNLKKQDLARIYETSDMIRNMLIDPNLAGVLGRAGVKLTDSVQEINAKLANETYKMEVADLSNKMVLDGAEVLASPAGVPKDELRVLTDSKGNKHYYRVKEDATGGGSGGGTASERSVKAMSNVISTNAINYPDAVVKYAAMDVPLKEINDAYRQSEMFKKWGEPAEDDFEMRLLWQYARGEITAAEYCNGLGGTLQADGSCKY